jgi:RNA polymerase sigma-B factor
MPKFPGSARTTEELLEELSQQISSGENPEETQSIREEIIQRFGGLVRDVAHEFRNSGAPWDDLVQAGYLGLLNAVQNFEYKRGLKFSTYATHLIRGEIRNYIREQHIIHIPEWLQRLSHRLQTAEAHFYKRHGRLPRLHELAEEINISPEGVQEILKARAAFTYISLDAERRGQDPRPRIDVTKIRSLDRHLFPIELRIRVAMAIEKLSELQQKVIDGLFYRGESQQEVGRRLGYSQKHVSRLKTESLRQIKKELEHGEKS